MILASSEGFSGTEEKYQIFNLKRKLEKEMALAEWTANYMSKLETENAYLLDLIDEFVEQDCGNDDGQYDSIAISTYAEAIDLLAEHGRLVIEHSSGRRRIARRAEK